MIKLEHISKSFKANNNSVHALHDISLEIHEGEIFGIVGKSGVGKSTLLKILSLSLKPDKGKFLWMEQDVSMLNDHNKRMLLQQTSFINQGFSLLYNLNVLDNVSLPLKLRGVDKDTRHKEAHRMLNFVGLESKAY